MLKFYVIDFKGNWDNNLQLIELTYNNNYHSSIDVAPIEEFYGRRCRYVVGWFKVGESLLLIREIFYDTSEKV